MKKSLINLWYQDINARPLYVNETAVRIRAGMLLLIPLFLGLTLYDVVYTSPYIVDTNTLVDTYETNKDQHTIYTAEVTHRVYEYSVQTVLIFYVLFELLSGMTVFTSRFSPSILLSSYFARNHPPVWKPLAPKRFAWTIGASVAVACLLFFNPDTFAGWLNHLAGRELLTETENFMPKGTGTTLVWVCLSFMWLETVFGFCVGCKVHALLVKIGLIKEECEACNNINWDKMPKNKVNE